MKAFLTAIFCLWGASVATAGDINVTADQKVEWHQKEQKIVAVGNAVATRGTDSIKADNLIAHYLGASADAKSKINRIEANGNVKMHSAKADAFGNTLDYDLTKDKAVLVGTPAQIKTENETISARDNITYYPSEQKAVATGNVEGTDKSGNKMYADDMIAYFTKESGKSSSLTLDKVNFSGNVKIVTKDATLTADRGTYFPQSGIVKLFDNVTINQSGNILHGDKAETNLNTGISKLLAGSKKGRVKGVFKEKK